MALDRATLTIGNATSPTANSVTFSLNSAGSAGGAIWCDNAGTYTIGDRAIFSGNTVTNATTGGGGAISIGFPSLTSTSIQLNLGG